MSVSQQHRGSSKRKFLPWLPAILTVGLGIVAATGLSMIPLVNAASTGNVTVQATVGPELHMTPCATQGPTALTLGGALENIGGGCVTSFGSNNNANGVNLRVANFQAGVFLCYGVGGARNCGTSSYGDELTTGTLNASVTADKAGVQLTAVEATAPAAVNDWPIATTTYGLPAAASPAQICHSVSTADRTCSTQFVARTAGTETAGTYEGVAEFSITARP